MSEIIEDDLISRAVAIKEIEPIRYCGDFISALIHLPAVNAVPVEWLRSQIKNDATDIESLYDNIVIEELIEKWQKELVESKREEK